MSENNNPDPNPNPPPSPEPNPNPNPTPPPVTDLRTFVDEKGTIAKPDDFFKAVGAPHLAKRFSTLEALTKSYVNAERMLSNGNKVAVPTEHSTPEEWDAFYKGIGRPESEDKYEVNIPDELKGLTLDENAMKEFRSTAFKNGLNGKQVKALTDFYFKSTKGAIDAVNAKMQERFDATMADLEKEWGPKDGAKFKDGVALAEKGAATLGLTADILKSTPELSNNPHFIRAMAKVAQMTKEAPAAGLRGQNGDLGQDVAGQIRAIMSDKNSPYWHKMHPDHAATVEKVAALHRQLHPEVKTS